MKESHGYDVNSGAGLVIICPKTRRLLLAHRNGSERFGSDTWCTFGGMMQNTENPLETALREVMEESELKPDNIIKEAIYVDQNCKNEPPGFKFYNFLALMNEEKPPKINNEHKDYNWYRLSELSNLNLHDGIKRMLSDKGSLELLKNNFNN